MIRLTTLALATTVGFLFALPVKADAWPDLSRILMPPPQFDPRLHEVPPHRVLFIARENMARACDLGPRVLACAIPSRGLILVPRGIPKALLRAVLRHERAHLLGWTHPDRTGANAIMLDSHNHEENEE